MEGGPRLIVVCGLPGAGKTTHAKQLEINRRGIRLCADEWMDMLAINLWNEEMRARTEALQWQISKTLLQLGQTVIIEWGTWARSERDTLRLGARQLGAAVELHFLDAPVDVLFARIKERNMETPPITREDVVKWSALFQRPAADELALFDASTVMETL